MPVELRNEQRKVRVDGIRIKWQAERSLALTGNEDQTLSILLTDDRRIAVLHERWMDDPSPTDVLSFPMGKLGARINPGTQRVPRVLGDIVISVETAARRKPADPSGEIRRVLVHGFLHLLGHDHRTKSERLKMGRQTRRLEKLLSV